MCTMPSKNVKKAPRLSLLGTQNPIPASSNMLIVRIHEGGNLACAGGKGHSGGWRVGVPGADRRNSPHGRGVACAAAQRTIPPQIRSPPVIVSVGPGMPAPQVLDEHRPRVGRWRAAGGVWALACGSENTKAVHAQGDRHGYRGQDVYCDRRRVGIGCGRGGGFCGGGGERRGG